MQVPAPFEYERATSVEHALTLLHSSAGPERVRILAGGHSLLPMMKLRLATPEYLIDIDDLAGELGYVREHEREGGPEIRIGAMTRHRRAARVAAAGGPGADLHRRRAGDRRPGRPQPRDDRRRAVPGRPLRGSQRRLRGGRRPDGDPRARRRAGRRDGRVSPRARTRPRVADDEMLIEIRVPRAARAPAAPTRRSTAASATGRSRPPAPRSRCADGASPTPGSAWRRSAPASAARRAQARCSAQRADRRRVRARRRGSPLTGGRTGHRPARLGRVQAPCRRRARRRRALHASGGASGREPGPDARRR